MLSNKYQKITMYFEIWISKKKIKFLFLPSNINNATFTLQCAAVAHALMADGKRSNHGFLHQDKFKLPVVQTYTD